MSTNLKIKNTSCLKAIVGIGLDTSGETQPKVHTNYKSEEEDAYSPKLMSSSYGPFSASPKRLVIEPYAEENIKITFAPQIIDVSMQRFQALL